MKFTFIFLFLFGISLICLVEGNPPDAPKPPKYDEDDEEALDEEEDEEGDGEEDDEDGEDDEYGDEYELEEGAEEDEYPEDEPPTTQPPTTTQTTTTTTISTTTQPTTTTTKQTTTTTMPTTTSTTTTKPTTTTSTTTTTQDPRKTLASRVMILLNNFSELQTTVNSATVQDQSCKEKISSSLVAYLAAGLKLEDSIYKESYSKGLDSLNKLEGELSEVKKDWNECLIRTTTTTTTEKPTTTTESTTEAPTTTKTEERRLKEFIPEFTIDPPKQEYAQEPNSAQDEEINKQLMEEIKRAEDMIEKQKQAINDPTLPLPPIEELADEPETKKVEEKTTKVEETTTKVEETTTILETTTQEITTTTTTTKKPTQQPTTKKPPTTTIKKIVTTQAPPTTVAYVYKHINHKFKSLKSTKDKAPAICNDSLDLYSGPRYAKSVCVINKNVNYNDAHELCVKEEMDLFAIQTVDHHLACRLKTQELFENIGSFWINGRYINDLWYYFSSENNFVKRFIYPGTQFDGSHTGNCLRLMKFGDHVAANAANCDLELPVFCEYYIQ